MKIFKRLFYTLVLALVANVGIAQFVNSNYNEIADYCHIDITSTERILHRDYDGRITITKDTMVVNVDNGENITFALGEFVYMEGVPSRSVRLVTNIERPDNNLSAMYIQDQFVAVKNTDSGNTIWFYLKDMCKQMVATGDDNWYVQDLEKDN